MLENQKCETNFNEHNGYSETMHKNGSLLFPLAKTAKFHSVFNRNVLNALEGIKEIIEREMKEGKIRTEYFLEKNEYPYSDIQTITTFLLNHGYEIKEKEEKNDGIEYIVIDVQWGNAEDDFYYKNQSKTLKRFEY